MKDQKVHTSELIINHHQEFVDLVSECYDFHQKIFNEDSTWSYAKYNFFSLAAPSPLARDLFDELRTLIPSDGKWMQCWINRHMSDEVLDWHNHDWDYHGYICIDPKETRTSFWDYSIVNEIGNIYIGPGHRQHKVCVDEEFDTPRLTLGFDITTHTAPPNEMLSLIPL